MRGSGAALHCGVGRSARRSGREGRRPDTSRIPTALLQDEVGLYGDYSAIAYYYVDLFVGDRRVGYRRVCKSRLLEAWFTLVYPHIRRGRCDASLATHT